MNYHLICVHPFGSYSKGQRITDPDEVARLLGDRDHHFVKIPAPAAPAPDASVDATADQSAQAATKRAAK